MALVLLRFVSGSLLVAMGDACGGIFEASHGFLAASNWNYLLATIFAAVLIPQLAFLLGGGMRLLRVTHAEKQKRQEVFSCSALSSLVPDKAYLSRVSVAAGSETLEAHTVGLFKPRIVVSAGLVRALDREQLDAVLAHEDAHRSARDNFFLVIAKSVSLTLFYLPGPRLALREMHAALERAADRRAAQQTGTLAVAGALACIAKATMSRQGVTGTEPAYSSAVTGADGRITARLEELLESRGSRKQRHWRWLAVFATGAALALTVFASSALAVADSDQRQAFICFTQHDAGYQP